MYNRRAYNTMPYNAGFGVDDFLVVAFIGTSVMGVTLGKSHSMSVTIVGLSVLTVRLFWWLTSPDASRVGWIPGGGQSAEWENSAPGSATWQ